jgi:dipeptidase
MCDTFVATGSFTSSGNIIFGKNSDREPNESQCLEVHGPRRGKGRRRLTFIDIPDADGYAVLLSRPFHMFGAEMGLNEHGLVIGNEAVFTKLKHKKKNDGLTGMDMIRLALERARTTDQAVEVITSLLEEYGQDACGGYEDRNMFYDNSFLIADGKTARVLETAGQYWASKPIEGYYAISNGLTIGEDFDLSSKDLADRTRKEGLRRKWQPMHFASVFSDTFYTTMSKCRIRRSLSEQRSSALARSGFTVQEAMAVLRSHNPEHPQDPSRMGMGSICLHASGLLTPSQTTASLVVETGRQGLQRIFATATSSPCISLFKPVAPPSASHLLAAGDDSSEGWISPGPYEDRSLWWQHEGLHRRILASYGELASVVLPERDEMERRWIEDRTADISHLSEMAFREHFRLLAVWKERLRDRLKTIAPPFRPLYRQYWNRQNSVMKEAL